MRGMFFRGVVLGSITSVLVVSASVALAGSGVGGIFNLGKSNSVNKTSSLTGSTPGATQLVVSNSATNTGSRGLLVTGHSPTGALLAQNSLGKAASFQSGSSYPPFDVNSTKKVTNLNADQLDGIDSSGLIQGKGKVYTLAVAIPRPTSGNEFNGYTPSPAVAPGFVNLSFGCPPVGSGGSGIGVSNLNGGEMNVFLRNTASPTAYYSPLQRVVWLCSRPPTAGTSRPSPSKASHPAPGSRQSLSRPSRASSALPTATSKSKR